MRIRDLVLTAFVASSSITPAWSLSFSQDGAHAWVVGRFEAGDGARFRAFLDQPRATPLRVVYLKSPGGYLTAGLEIGRAIRRAGLSTAVLADQHVCDSACTLAFVGGVRRHNVRGDTVFEGMSGMMGLGFHPAHRRGTFVTPSMRAEEGTGWIRAFYAEMGVPRAAEFMDRAAFNTLYRPSGRATLETRTATSLGAP